MFLAAILGCRCESSNSSSHYEPWGSCDWGWQSREMRSVSSLMVLWSSQTMWENKHCDLVTARNWPLENMLSPVLGSAKMLRVRWMRVQGVEVRGVMSHLLLAYHLSMRLLKCLPPTWRNPEASRSQDSLEVLQKHRFSSHTQCSNRAYLLREYPHSSDDPAQWFSAGLGTLGDPGSFQRICEAKFALRTMFPLFILILLQKYEAQKSTDLLSDPTCNKPLRNDLSLGYSHIKKYPQFSKKILEILFPPTPCLMRPDFCHRFYPKATYQTVWWQKPIRESGFIPPNVVVLCKWTSDTPPMRVSLFFFWKI